MTPAPEWAGSTRVLLRDGRVLGMPSARAILIVDDRIAWVGDDTTGIVAEEVIDLDGAVVAPGFVDAHVHATSTGLALIGLDLTPADDLDSALAMITAAAARGGVLIGHGWDETRWPQSRPPSRSEIDAAVDGAPAYLSRIDVHSALVSTALLDLVPGVHELDGFSVDGPVTRAAHHAVREVAQGHVAEERRSDAQRATRSRAAALGIVAMQEMAGPVISSAEDLRDLLALARTEPGPLVHGYWGELAQRGGIARARELGAIGVAGDLFIDGSIGSRTACLRTPYLDEPHSLGAQYLSADEVQGHVEEASAAGMQAGFHVIGDAATDIVIGALERAANAVGIDRFRSMRHRLEHAEMLDARHLQSLARLGVSVSMQPVFDALWGGEGGMYERRLGAQRMRGMNGFAAIDRAGILMAFGSDAPVTPLGPWQGVDAAMAHHQLDERIGPDAAFTAHTRAGWQAIGCDDAGMIAAGAQAHLVVWDDLDSRRALRTIVSGCTVHDSGALS